MKRPFKSLFVLLLIIFIASCSVENCDTTTVTFNNHSDTNYDLYINDVFEAYIDAHESLDIDLY